MFKVWSVPPSNVSHVTREEVLQPKRIPSVFVNNTDNKAEPMEINEVEGLVHEDVKKVSCLSCLLPPQDDVWFFFHVPLL